jgi:putative transposase
LRDLEVRHPDHVWCADITYVRMPRGRAYLYAVRDRFSRKVLGWRLSNVMDAELCLGALRDAVESSAGRVTEILNTDQGSQFTGEMWTCPLEDLGTAVSMDGTSRCMDNVVRERLW